MLHNMDEITTALGHKPVLGAILGFSSGVLAWMDITTGHVTADGVIYIIKNVGICAGALASVLSCIGWIRQNLFNSKDKK
jgi:hypothetical protein